MRIEQKENYILVSSKSDNFVDFLSNFKEKHTELEENNLIIQFSESINIFEENILVFLKYAKLHQENGTTFVVIANNINIDNFPEWFNIVPSFVEAKDVLEMEEMQRDLGF